ncbi:secreted RxLR effector protein 161-like [Aristolochia californica]|uniref:secreted RxLR effector protein 161-like n=1 Tax=Aristolochia californica TaxID=171875 RepID=UPI0035DEBA20
MPYMALNRPPERVYVDDVILTGSGSSDITQLVQLLSADFPLKDLGDLHYFLGIECHRNLNGMSVVGSLQYLLFTRPDLAFLVNRVCQFMHAPCLSHWQSMKRILRYLKQTLDYGLALTPSRSPFLSALSDADWVGCPDDRKSTSGYCLFYGTNLIYWSSKKQTTIARSSTEAKYKALAHATCELVWVQSLLSELGVFLSKSPVLYCDNLGATYL